jgi:hypothetical protein
MAPLIYRMGGVQNILLYGKSKNNLRSIDFEKRITTRNNMILG